MLIRQKTIDEFNYRVIKMNPRPRPERKGDILIVPMFSEFGCETMGVLYCLPELLRKRWSGKYIIILAWEGRDYLYRGLADEVWELAEEHQDLRQYCRAFHHNSLSLKRFEKEAGKNGTLIPIGTVSNVCIFPKMTNCKHCKSSVFDCKDFQQCGRCGQKYDPVGTFYNLVEAKNNARWLLEPSKEAFERVSSFLPENAVGITARNRKTYERNLSIDFYKRLIFQIEDMGYVPVWLGEKSSIYPCPYKRVLDFSESPLSKNLENTLALVSKMKFTVQAYTASSRLAAMTGTPFVIVESPDQIWGVGQEGIRLNLLSKNEKRKLIACQFLDAKDRPNELLSLIVRGIEEIESDNYSDIIGMVSNKNIALNMKNKNSERIGEILRWFCEK